MIDSMVKEKSGRSIDQSMLMEKREGEKRREKGKGSLLHASGPLQVIFALKHLE